MRARSKIWTKLASRGEFSVESKAIINGKEYLTISAPKIDRQTMQNPLSIGNCCNASLELSVLLEDSNDTIPTGAKVVIKSRLFDTTSVSEWLEFGTFYIDSREDSYEGLIKITAYDAMLKTEQEFVADDNFNTLGWPKTMKDVVEMIADRIGVGIDPRTSIKTGSDYVVQLPTGLTVRQVLGYIGACHGGNWIITEENMLRLVPLVQCPTETYKIISADYEDIIVPPGDTLVWKKPDDEIVADLTNSNVAKVAITDKARKDYNIVDESGNTIVTNDGYTLVWGSDKNIYAVNGVINVPVVKGDLSTGTSVVITNVIASQTKTMNISSSESDDDNTSEQSVTTSFTAQGGNSDGATLDAGDSPYMTQQICDDLLADFKGLIYAPYTAKSTVYDPATEIGDQIKIGDKVFSVIYNNSITLNIAFTSDLSIPAQEESSSEYPYNPESAKVQDLLKSVQTSILRLDNSIKLQVSRLEEADDEHYDAVIELLADYTKTGELVTKINASADVITLTGGRLVITTGNFLLDKQGNVTINNGTFKGTVSTGTSTEGSGATLGNGVLSLESNSTTYLKIYAGAWGKLTGGIMKCENYLAVVDPSGGFVFAINTGGDPNKFSEGILCFDDCYFDSDINVKSSATVQLGSNQITFSGNYIGCDSSIQASGFTFTDAPLSNTTAKSLSACLEHLENRIAKLEG